MIVRPLAVLLALACSTQALAQEAETPAVEPAPVPEAAPAVVEPAPAPAPETAAAPATDQEDRASVLDTKQDKKLEAHVSFETEWHEFDNVDFRRLDESSDQAILDSDDRNGFAYTGVGLELGYKIDDSVRFVMGTSYRGLWGNDQIGNVNRFGGFLYFTSLYVEYAPAQWKYKPTFRVGRQRFDLGGLGGAREFIFGDVVDMVRVDLPLGKVGTLTVIPINVVGLSAENDDVNFVGYLGQADTELFGFRGDRMTRRYGGLLTIAPESVPGLDARAYAFYTDQGAAGSGSDISYGGELGNFSDNDWVFNAGVRASYEIADLVTPWAEFDASVGIDRKELVVQDVNTTGFAWGAGVVVDHPGASTKAFGAHAELAYFEAQGPVYSANGQLFSHGYVGMKARQVGGLLADRFLGWHPSAYVGAWGLEDTPHDTSRKSGTRVVSATGDFHLPGPLSVGVGYWFLQDTGVTALDLDKLDTITPPYGYSREEYAAEARMGRVLGHEIDGSLTLALTPTLSLVGQGGALLPGKFYGIEIGRTAGTALGSPAPATLWTAGGGVAVDF